MLLLLLANPSWAIINVRFTPVVLVRDSTSILVGTLAAGPNRDQWKFTVSECLKGKKANELLLGLRTANEETAQNVRTLLASNGAEPAIMFMCRDNEMALAYLHVCGTYLELKLRAQGGWEVRAVALKMSDVFAGGTDMLIRMTRYILSDPKADVPVSVGVAWMREKALLGKLEGAISVLHSVELGTERLPHVHAASDKGDRLYRTKKGDEAFEDVTSATGLDSKSRQALWLDLDGAGGPQLISWDGASITVRTLTDGKFSLTGQPYPFAGVCLGLAPCRNPSGNKPAILVSANAAPFVLHRIAGGAWATATLPVGNKAEEAGEVTCACIVADLDNDGFVDVLQPRSKAGLLWKGQAGGFAPPVKSPVDCPEAPGRFCMGDFDGDGSLDIFISGPLKNELWENDGAGRFKPVLSAAGTLSYKCNAGASFCGTMDLNHDGRSDLCMLYPEGELDYHFNRGYRCLGMEGELRLQAPEDTPLGTGQVACAVADFNGDGVLDLVTAFADGQIVCYYNDAFNKPMIRVGLAKGLCGPVTFSVWQGEKCASCLGTFTAAGLPVSVPLRDLRACAIKYAVPGKPQQVQAVQVPAKVPAGGLDVLLAP